MSAVFSVHANEQVRITTVLPDPTIFTVMFWAKFNGPTATFKPLWYRYNNSGEPYMFWGTNNAAGHVHYFDFDVNNTVALANGSGTSLTGGVWYHFALVFNAGTATVFLNGVQDIQASQGAAPNSFANDMMMFGHNDDTDAESGQCSMCAIKVWDNLALTVDQVQAEMWFTRARLRNQLWLELPMECASDIIDRSGHGTLVSALGFITHPDAPPLLDFVWFPYTPPLALNAITTRRWLLTR